MGDDDEVASSSNTATTNSESAALLPGTGKTLVAPAGWAFAIWGPIFTGELAFVISQFFAKDKQLLASQIQSISAPFVIAQLFQTLCCISTQIYRQFDVDQYWNAWWCGVLPLQSPCCVHIVGQNSRIVLVGVCHLLSANFATLWLDYGCYPCQPQWCRCGR